MRLARVASCLLVAWLGLAPATAAEWPEIEYAYPDQSVWTARENPQGDPENPLLRLAAVLFARAGIPWHGRAYPAARMFDYLQNGTAQFSMLVRAPALQACCLFSAQPVASTELRVYRLAETPAVTRQEDLVGRSVIVIRGYSYGGLGTFLKDPANRVAAQVAVTHEAAFAMLERGRAEYLLDYTGPASEVLGAAPARRIASDPLSRLDVHMVLSRSYPNAAAVMERLEAIAARLDKQSVIEGR